VEHDHAFTVDVAVQCPADALATAGTKLEETVTQRRDRGIRRSGPNSMSNSTRRA